MTQVITRYFESAKQARATRHELLHRRRFSGWIVHLFEVADGLADKLAAKNVEAKTAKAYAKYLKLGVAVLLVQAGSKPLGGAKITRDAMTAMGATALDGLMEEVRVQDLPKTMLGVLNDHPHMLTRERDPYNTNFYMANWPIPLISRHKPMSLSMFPKHARMASFPISLISRRKPFTGSVFGRHVRMANFPLPLISKRKPFTGSIFGRHARMASFPLPLTNRRKPYTGTAIGRHTRMANGPFPHLTNGKQGTNSLVPSGARMANFPISLISDRQPTNRSIFPKHARMANFPLPLISRR
ncbi:MAG: PucR family transcriptional regulator [Planktotalea sp.]|uniref:PucR family transcriptional regulator n=1 Tax=Planktotalea sp. TaxID=2029877 RepID=UPI002635039D|nr:PucR family transcriptional regulator [Planktotalea sp.]MDG1076645.1 PucR family transcriptional regulator [Planktotalea sp.]MDG1082653.1 PucR family transcriptional regulator [Planktotalea sp.]